MSTYYVSNSGSDSNNGTSTSTPFATWSHAATVAVSGDTILGHGGDTIADNPSFSVPLTIGSYGTGQTTIYVGSGQGMYFTLPAGGLTVNNVAIIGAGSTYAGGTYYDLFA